MVRMTISLRLSNFRRELFNPSNEKGNWQMRFLGYDSLLTFAKYWEGV